MTNRILAAVILLFLMGFVPGCGKAAKETETENKAIRVGVLKGPTAMSIIGMIDKPPLIESGNKKYAVQFTVKANPKLLRVELLQENLDIAIVPTTLAAVLYNKGIAYQSAAVPIWGTLVLMENKEMSVPINEDVSFPGMQQGSHVPGQDKTSFNWGLLRKRDVHLMGKGFTPDILFRLLLEKKGLKAGTDVNVNYRFPQPQDLAQALAGGAVELAVISEPMASTVRARNPNIRVLADLAVELEKAGNGTVPFTQDVVVVKTRFARNHPQLVRKFLTMYEQTLDTVNREPAKAGELIARHGLAPDAEIAAASIPRCHFRYRSVREAKDQIAAYLGIFYKLNPKIIGGRLPNEGFYYREQK